MRGGFRRQEEVRHLQDDDADPLAVAVHFGADRLTRDAAHDADDLRCRHHHLAVAPGYAELVQDEQVARLQGIAFGQENQRDLRVVPKIECRVGDEGREIGRHVEAARGVAARRLHQRGQRPDGRSVRRFRTTPSGCQGPRSLSA
jgi:hypothetical protein